MTCLGSGAFQFLFRALLQTLCCLRRFFTAALGFLPETLGCFPLGLKLLAGSLQLRDNILKAGVLGGNKLLCALDNLPIQTQPLADQKRIRTPGNSSQQAIGRRKGVDVKLTACVFYPFCFKGIHLNLGIMSGGGDFGPFVFERLQN